VARLKHRDTGFIGGCTSSSLPPSCGTCYFAPNICSSGSSLRGQRCQAICRLWQGSA